MTAAIVVPAVRSKAAFGVTWAASLPAVDVPRQLDTSPDVGLSGPEVIRRRVCYGSGAVISGVIAALSVGLGFVNEYRAERRHCIRRSIQKRWSSGTGGRPGSTWSISFPGTS